MIKQECGITLIAIVVTIVVLLILASISIGVLGGEDGLIKQAQKAKQETEISEEKELLGRAMVQAAGKDAYGNIEEEALQKELDKEVGEEKIEVTDIGEEFEIIFKENNRYYIVDKDGNIGEAQEIIEDKNPGNITKDKDGNELDGSEEKPYEIWCIEDLVVLSNLSRGKGNYIDNEEIKDAEKNTFSGKTIKLMRTLNFNSKTSYADLSKTWSYNDEEDAYVIDENGTQNLMDLLIDKNGCGFVPISEVTGSSFLMFAGIFDGQNFEIQNLYENRDDGGGLFSSIYAATIKNLKLSNVNINTNRTSGGITSISESGKIYNCYISGYIKGNSSGGVIGSAWGNAEIINCCNLAKIDALTTAGGIIAYRDINGITNIINCYNSGEIYGRQTVENYNRVSGIIGWAYSTGTRNIINTCSIGAIKKENGTSQNFYGVNGGATVELENCYYLDTNVNENVIINENSIAFHKGDKNIIDKLNTYVEEHKNDYTVELYTWKLNSDGLPVF